MAVYNLARETSYHSVKQMHMEFIYLTYCTGKLRLKL